MVSCGTTTRVQLFLCPLSNKTRDKCSWVVKISVILKILMVEKVLIVFSWFILFYFFDSVDFLYPLYIPEKYLWTATLPGNICSSFAQFTIEAKMIHLFLSYWVHSRFSVEMCLMLHVWWSSSVVVSRNCLPHANDSLWEADTACLQQHTHPCGPNSNSQTARLTLME